MFGVFLPSDWEWLAIDQVANTVPVPQCPPRRSSFCITSCLVLLWRASTRGLAANNIRHARMFNRRRASSACWDTACQDQAFWDDTVPDYECALHEPPESAEEASKISPLYEQFFSAETLNFVKILKTSPSSGRPLIYDTSIPSSSA